MPTPKTEASALLLSVLISGSLASALLVLSHDSHPSVASSPVTQIGRDPGGWPPTFSSYSGWTWTVAGIVSGYQWEGCQGVVFRDCFLWYLGNSSAVAVFCHNMTSGRTGRLFAVWKPNTLCYAAVIDDAYYVVEHYARYPTYNGTIYSSTDLSSWTRVASTDSFCPQSIGKYEPTGTLIAGGVYSLGRGTFTQICSIADNRFRKVWSGTIKSSDDGVDVVMFNETHMIVLDTYPVNPIWSNNPQVSWTDDAAFDGAFNWTFRGEIWNGFYCGPCQQDHGGGGLITWDGKTTTSIDLGMTCWAVANGTVALSDGPQVDPHGDRADFHPAIWTYNSTGLDRRLVSCDYTGKVAGLAYDAANNWLWAAFWIPGYGNMTYVLRGVPPVEAEAEPSQGRSIDLQAAAPTDPSEGDRSVSAHGTRLRQSPSET